MHICQMFLVTIPTSHHLTSAMAKSTGPRLSDTPYFACCCKRNSFLRWELRLVWVVKRVIPTSFCILVSQTLLFLDPQFSAEMEPYSIFSIFRSIYLRNLSFFRLFRVETCTCEPSLLRSSQTNRKIE